VSGLWTFHCPLTRHIYKLGQISDPLVAGVISKCPAYSLLLLVPCGAQVLWTVHMLNLSDCCKIPVTDCFSLLKVQDWVPHPHSAVLHNQYMWHHGHCLTMQFLQVSIKEVWQKILQELGHRRCWWSVILGRSMKSCCGLLGQMFVTSLFHRACEHYACCGTPWKIISLCDHLKQEQYFHQKCDVILYNGTDEMGSV
jgi:hypothetical protein